MNINNLKFIAMKINSLTDRFFKKIDPKILPQSYLIAAELVDGKYSFFVEAGEVCENEDVIRIGLQNIFSQERVVEIDDIIETIEITEKVKLFFDAYDKKLGTVSLVSPYVKVGDFYIIILLQLPSQEYHAHHRIFSEQENSFIFPSMLDAAVSRFLGETSSYLYRILENRVPIVEDNEYEDHIIKVAGNSFLHSIDRIISGRTYSFTGMMPDDTVKIYDDFNMISSLLYEGRECKGQILLTPRGKLNIQEKYHFKTKLSLRNHRSVRKLLEITSRETYLLYNSGEIYGIGFVDEKSLLEDDKIFSVVFKKHMSWAIYHMTVEVLSVINGLPKINEDLFDRKLVRRSLRKIFPGLPDGNTEKIIEMIDYSTHQTHGTILIFSKEAEKEALRLKNESYLMEPFVLDAKNLVQFSNIDGAIILDEHCNCYALGVILDGTASDRGDSSRGARYNSSIRYIDNRKGKALAVVVSEDGTIDIIL